MNSKIFSEDEIRFQALILYVDYHRGHRIPEDNALDSTYFWYQAQKKLHNELEFCIARKAYGLWHQAGSPEGSQWSQHFLVSS